LQRHRAACRRAIHLATLGVLAGILAVVDVALAFVSRATFQREEILTRWT